MIERAIHEILTDTDLPAVAVLLDLLPAASIVTGTISDADLPYATISTEANTANYRSNKGSARNLRVRIQVMHDNHYEGTQMRDAIVAVFENQSFTTSGLSVICARHENSFALQEEDGVWQFTIDLLITHTL